MIRNDPCGCELHRCAPALFARRATSGDRKRLALVLGHAFYSDPLLSWVVDEDSAAGRTGYGPPAFGSRPSERKRNGDKDEILLSCDGSAGFEDNNVEGGRVSHYGLIEFDQSPGNGCEHSVLANAGDGVARRRRAASTDPYAEPSRCLR
jgi:hypothetical protein